MAAFERPVVLDLGRLKIGSGEIDIQQGWYIDESLPPAATRCDELLFVQNPKDRLRTEPGESFRLFARLDVLGGVDCRGGLVRGVQIEDWRRQRAGNPVPECFIPTSVVRSIDPQEEGMEAYLAVIDTGESAYYSGEAMHAIAVSGVAEIVAKGRITDERVMDPEQRLGGYSLLRMLPGARLAIRTAGCDVPTHVTYVPGAAPHPFIVH